MPRSARASRATSRPTALPEPGERIEDELLIKPDKNPNRRAAAPSIRRCPPTPRAASPPDATSSWCGAKAATSRACRPERSRLPRRLAASGPGPADVFLPISVQTERSGHYTNFAGVVSRFEACFEKPAGVADAEALFAALAVPARVTRHDAGPQRRPRLHRLRDGDADHLRHGADLGRAQAGGGDVRSHRRQPRLHPHSVHAGQADLVGPLPRHRRRPEDDAEGELPAASPTTASPTRIAPWVVFTPVLLVFAVVPFGGTLDPGRLVPPLADWFHGRTYPMQIARLDAGLLVVFAFSGLTIIGTMLAGWSSANKFSLLGGLRAGSQMISYELVMGLTVLGLILHLRHDRPRRDRAPAVGHRCSAGCRPGASSTSPSARCSS